MESILLNKGRFFQNVLSQRCLTNSNVDVDITFQKVEKKLWSCDFKMSQRRGFEFLLRCIFPFTSLHSFHTGLLKSDTSLKMENFASRDQAKCDQWEERWLPWQLQAGRFGRHIQAGIFRQADLGSWESQRCLPGHDYAVNRAPFGRRNFPGLRSGFSNFPSVSFFFLNLSCHCRLPR